MIGQAGWLRRIRGPASIGLALAIAVGSVACGPAPTAQERGGKSVPHASDVKAASAPKPASVAAPPVAPAPAAAGRPASAPGEAAGQAANAQGQAWDRMVIRNATISLFVEDVETALALVRQIAQRGDGYVAASQTSYEKTPMEGAESRMVASVTIQVRAEAFDQAVQELRGMAVKVESEIGTSQDVTEEYVDLESGLRNLKATEIQIIRLMERAEKLEDIMVLQREITQIRGQIERLEGRKRYLERRSDMATIAVNLRLPPIENTQPAPTVGAWDPLASAQRGWQASLRILRGVADVVIVALAFSWWMLPFLGVGAYALTRRPSRESAPPAPIEG